MKTREQIYGQEAAGILRDVSMYRALTEMQLLKLYPHKESKIRNLLSYLQKQGRIVQRGEYYRIPADAEAGIDYGLSKAIWVLTDFMEQVEYHSVSEYPAKIIFFADGEVYEIIYAEPGKEQLIRVTSPAAFLWLRRRMCGITRPSRVRAMVTSMAVVTPTPIPMKCTWAISIGC